MLSVVFVVNTSLKCLKLNQNAYTSHILCIWSVWASASTHIYCCTLTTTPLRIFLNSNWYTPEVPAFSPFPTLCCISTFSQGEFSCRGEVFSLYPCLCLMSSLVNKGERFWDFSVPLSRGRNLVFRASSHPKGRDVLFGAIGLWERFFRVLWQGEQNWAFWSFC
jgi:hypothetical protein